MNLCIFNPDTDYALGADTVSYTPPKRVQELQRSLIMTATSYAKPGDAILLPDAIELSDALPSEYKWLYLKDLKKFDFERVIPWGWNRALCHTLAAHGVNSALLKTEEELSALRRLAHRSTTIKFLTQYSKRNPEFPPEMIPRVIFEYSELPDGAYYLKAPWSSAGRGVIYTPHHKKGESAKWVKGIVNRQGAVIAESAWDRVLDFATEWYYDKGRATFLGLSLFKADKDGRYKENYLSLTQDEIEKEIRKRTASFGSVLLDNQKRILEKIIGEDYSGPLGIDMLVDSEGRINPCVEINFRMTMGIVALGPSVIYGKG